MTMQPSLKLTAYMGDRDRDRGGRRLLADAALELFAEHDIQAGVMLRGIEGFGIKHRLHTERLLTLSEDLPVLAVAIDTHSRIEALTEDLQAISPHGLITLERIRPFAPAQASSAPARDGSAAKLTIVLGRRQRVGGAPAHEAAVACLHRHGALGANVLLGLDGTVQGARRRARMLASNEDVPTMILAVGQAELLGAAIAELAALIPGAQMALESIQVCKRDGQFLAGPAPPPAPASPPAADGLGYWQKLTLHGGERARPGQERLHGALLRRLRLAGAAGATTLRGVWGFYGDHEPHGERFWSLARHTPLQTVVLDTPHNIARWFELLDELTARAGLVTCEAVPAFRAAGPQIELGELRLAGPADP